VNEQVVTVRIRVVRKLVKKRTGQLAEDEYEYEYQCEYDLWVVVTGLPAAQVKVTFEKAKPTPREILRGIGEAASDTAAEKVTGMAWQITGLSDNDTGSLLWDLPDKVQGRIEELLHKGLAETGSPEDLSVPVAAVGATFLLKPVLRPAKEVIHVAEVIAIITASLIGAHALAAGALKALMRDQISAALAKIIDDATDPPTATGDATDPPTVTGPAAGALG
jgi:hypothetical protein